jgi:NAD(P)-dependent dehydrogenase (short-subunit alcohol dehydrogenase family)
MRKVLLITGASRGIGLATATHFKAQGFDIVNVSRSSCTLPGVVQINADLAQPQCLDEAGEQISNALAGSEQVVVVHNAGLQIPGNTATQDMATFQQIMAINVVAPAAINRLVCDALPSGSSIIYIGSTLSLKAIANMSAYATSKHALIGLMRSTCQDLAGQGIHTACVCPGFTDTEMLKSYSGDVVEQLKQRSTQGRLVAPQEIAEAVYFCATNSVVNGTVLQAESGLIEY